MITVQKVIDAVHNLLALQYPACTFYIHGLPQSFERPSFCIRMVGDRSAGFNQVITRESLSLQVDYQAPLDAGQLPDRTDQMAVYQAMKDLFRKGPLQVDGRALEIFGLRAELQGTDIGLAIDFEYLEDRPQEQENYELMQNIIIKEVF